MPPPVVRVPRHIGRSAFVDVPSYTGNAGKALVVNDTGDGFAYVSVSLAAHNHAGEDITSGTIADARIASTITRDSEVMAIVLASDGNGSGLDADLLDGNDSSAFAAAGHSHTGIYQPLNAELTAIASLVGAANTVPSFAGPGAAVLLNVGTAANNLVKLDANAKLPAVDGSQLTNLPGGSTTQVQYNLSGVFAGDAGMTYDAANDALTVSGRVVTGVIRPPSDGTLAIQFQTAGGSTVMAINTTNQRVKAGVFVSPGAGAVLNPGGTRTDSYFEWLKPDNSLAWHIRNDGVAIFGTGMSVQSQFQTYAGVQFWGGSLGRAEANSPLITPFTTKVELTTVSAGNLGLVIKGAPSQTGASFRVVNNSDVVQFEIQPDGKLRTNQAANNTNTPSGATAKALPIYNTAGSLEGYIPVYGSPW